jgi:hypothetical protein
MATRPLDADEHVPASVVKIHNFLTRHAKLILFGWTLLFVLGASFATYFINKAQDRLTAPFHSRAGKCFVRFFADFRSPVTTHRKLHSDAASELTL